MNYTKLNKVISETGYCSIREASTLIANGKVKVNGIIADKRRKVSTKDEVCVEGKIIIHKTQNIYLAFNKPVGVTCTTEAAVKDNIIDYINYPEYVYPIGRLDKASEGLIFLTNDGEIVNKILLSENKHEKEYFVTVDKKITTTFIQKMGEGVPILNTVTNKCKVNWINDYTFQIILTQGLNRQIRRMCTYFGYEVKKLMRTRIMNITTSGINVGDYRSFTVNEIRELFLSLNNSDNVADMQVDFEF